MSEPCAECRAPIGHRQSCSEVSDVFCLTCLAENGAMPADPIHKADFDEHMRALHPEYVKGVNEWELRTHNHDAG